MKVGKVVVNTAHKRWCQSFMNEQAQAIKNVRKILKRSSSVNPFAENKQTDRILSEYEKSFWGKDGCWSDKPRLI